MIWRGYFCQFSASNQTFFCKKCLRICRYYYYAVVYFTVKVYQVRTLRKPGDYFVTSWIVWTMANTNLWSRSRCNNGSSRWVKQEKYCTVAPGYSYWIEALLRGPTSCEDLFWFEQITSHPPELLTRNHFLSDNQKTFCAEFMIGCIFEIERGDEIKLFYGCI